MKHGIEKATPTAAIPKTTQPNDTSAASQRNTIRRILQQQGRLTTLEARANGIMHPAMLDTLQRLGAIFRPCGNSRARFGRLNHTGGHKATVKRASFFVSAIQPPVGGWVWEPSGCRVSQCDRSTNLHSAAFFVWSRKGEQFTLEAHYEQ